MNYKKVLKGNIPNHIAIILDGNGRWAKKRGMPRTYGHQNGVKALIDVAKAANEIGVKELTVFAFSTENWNRPKDEIDYLMEAPIEYLNNNIEKLKESNIKIVFVGRRSQFDIPTLHAIGDIMQATENNRGMVLNIAFDYGGRFDIVLAAKSIASRILMDEITISDITEESFQKELLVKSNVDLLIRTSGELRVSNFVLWQMAYAEFYFTKCLWPDFNKKELIRAINSFQKRNRRFGGLNHEVKI